MDRKEEMKLLYMAQLVMNPIGGAEISTINLIDSLKSNGVIVDYIDSSNVEKFNQDISLMGPEKYFKDYDAILTQLNWTGQVLDLAKAAGKKAIYFFHSWEHICKVGHTGIIPAICNRICRHCYYKNKEFKPDYTIANSEYTKRMLEDHYDIKSEVIYPSLNLKDFICKDRSPEYITMSRLHYMKGTDRFIKIAKRMPDHKFRIVGYGKESWDDDIPANVTVSGHLSPKECYQKASLWLSPSRFDSFGMTVIEAQLNNIPTIATNICAVKEDETVMLGSTIDDGDDIDEWIEKISYWNKKVDTIKPNRSMLEKFVTTESGATLMKIIENLT